MEQGKQIGEWKCLRILGKGSFGQVALWKNIQNGNLTALKTFEVRSSMHANGSPEFITEMKERWKKEVDMMYNMIDSEFIVSTIPVPKDFDSLSKISSHDVGPLPVLCMQYCSGGDLRQILKRPENIAGLREKEVIRVISHIGQAILYLHDRNIIHRDLKPENVLIYHQPSEMGVSKPFYKLSDLGFAKDLTTSSICSTVVGTLQYLAPEIYMGKKYNKTVDYWSFGLIAFEITCGMRPFLHGESPSQWIPHVEEKDPEVICLSRAEDGRVNHCKEIPYNTHLSIPLKQCLETWLKVILQFDHNKRGCKLVPSSSKRAGEKFDDQAFGLNMLTNILSFQYLEVLTPQTRLSYSVRNSAHIGDIQEWIARDTGMLVENQLLFTLDGVEPKKDDLASKFIQLSELYAIPRNHKWIRQKSKLPKDLNNFLTSYENVKDPAILRKAWSSAIYYAQTEINQIETLKKMSDILRNWMAKTCVNGLKSIQADVDRKSASFERILEMESKLEEIDGKHGFKINVSAEDWRAEANTLRDYYESCFGDWEDNLVLKIVRTSDVEEIYHKILKGCEDWRCAEQGTQAKASHVHSLVRNLCNFMVHRDLIMDGVCQNIGAQLQKIDSGRALIEKLDGIVKRFKTFIDEVIQNRCIKQQELFKIVFKSTLSGENVNCNGEPVYATPNRMSKSTDPTNIGQSVIIPASRSLDANQLPSNSAKELSDIMMCSQILQQEIEGSLHNALEQVSAIMKEKDDLDWEFLD